MKKILLLKRASLSRIVSLFRLIKTHFLSVLQPLDIRCRKWISWCIGWMALIKTGLLWAKALLSLIPICGMVIMCSVWKRLIVMVFGGLKNICYIFIFFLLFIFRSGHIAFIYCCLLSVLYMPFAISGSAAAGSIAVNSRSLSRKKNARFITLK